MRSPLPSLLLLLAACHFACSAAAAGRGALVGGWSPIGDTNDQHVQELGRWAVSEHNKQANDGLVFRKVVRGESQVVAGMNYRLVVAAAAGAGKSAMYEAVVFEQVWTNTRKLTSFTPAK